MSDFKVPYEISAWSDVLTFVIKLKRNGRIEECEKLPLEDHEVIAQYYKEKKLAILGSDSSSAVINAFNAKITSNINGTSTLTFQLFHNYYDENSEENIENPLIKLLVNERKIKLKILENKVYKWYDFVIKDISEDSLNNIFTYTAKDLYINELSKTGFNLEFDDKLGNNINNINELTKEVLKGSDWQLKENLSLKQFREEPLYEIIVPEGLAISAKKVDLSNPSNTESVPIPDRASIFVYYSVIENEDTYFQFMYGDPAFTDQDKDSNNVIQKEDCYYLIDGEISYENNKVLYNGKSFITIPECKISNSFRGKRPIRKPKLVYEEALKKFVNLYNYNGEQIRGYKDTEYISPVAVQNYVTNAKDYESLTGWKTGSLSKSQYYPEKKLVTVPDLRDGSVSSNFPSYIKMTAKNSNDVLFNSGISDYKHSYKKFSAGDKYVFRIKFGIENTAGTSGQASSLKISNIPVTFRVGTYSLAEGKYVINNLFSGSVSYSSSDINKVLPEDDTMYVSSICTCTRSLSESEVKNQTIGLFISFDSNIVQNYYIRDVQFFPYEDNGKGSFIIPGASQSFFATIQTLYHYYKSNQEYKKSEDISYIWESEEPLAGAELIYNVNSFEKVRTLRASATNRYNLIQTLCELFECWPNFEIEHDKDGSGRIALTEDYRQKKFVSFKEYVGKNNYAGFKYGINLKQIQRKIDSEAIVSKIVVKNNSNQFAKNGFCSIARSNENYSKENFIYNFDYYIQKGLLDIDAVNNDLYSIRYVDDKGQRAPQGYIGYYKELRKINQKRDEYINKQTTLSKDLPKYRADYQKYEISVIETQELLSDKEVELQDLTSHSYSYMMTHKNDSWWDKEEGIRILTSIARLNNLLKQYTTLRDNCKLILDSAEQQFLTNKEELEKIKTEKEKLHLEFFKKYSRFIQEGSWIKEDYTDDTLYYLDAENTLFASSKPKISYTINVLELSEIPGFENYYFNLGDRTYVEDKEFFGMNLNGTEPYKEEIVVTELTKFLDSPEKNIIKVQNYKSQFDDLFQRITATTQSLEYSSGKYNKTSNIIKEDGTIKIDTLQNSMSNNSLRLQNAKDQSVTWDDTGITTVCLSKPSEMLRIISGGIFLSTDGGLSWSTGISGSGINANYINSGQIDTNVIRIMSGINPSFRWDTSGINAYHFSLENGKPNAFSSTKFVRFDQYGIYGIDGSSNFDPGKRGETILTDTSEIEKNIQDNASFSLTWGGFQLHSKHNGGIKITPTDDIQIFNKNNKEIIRIGQLDVEKSGIRIKDDSEKIVMETAQNGTLWLRNCLYIGKESTNPGDSKVKIGYLEEKKSDTNIHEVINIGDAGSEFLVYEDGSVKATNGEFKGTITATGGTIGNLTIEQVEQSNKYVEIIAEQGTIFKITKNQQTPSPLTLGTKISNIDHESLKWYYSTDFLNWIEMTSDQGKKKIEVSYDFFKQHNVSDNCGIKVSIKEKVSGKEYVDQIVLNSLSDGISAPVYTYQIISSKGKVINESVETDITTTLTAKIFKDSEEIKSDEISNLIFTWYYSSDGGLPIKITKTGFWVDKEVTKATLIFPLEKFNKYTQIWFEAQ